ncbi:MAG: tRNA (uridine(34)/cytosine(34)/5-carboxymethylaminomethyluridine(34)-2'-O)-methyltransferase TrmL [Acidobacteriota bacterium]
MNIVLVEPEIPQNTGNVSRTCALTRCRLHLVKPLGFSIDDRQLKRAGLDYWEYVDLVLWDSFEELVNNHRGSRFFLATTKAGQRYDRQQYNDDDFIVFGKETKGLPAEILAMFPDSQIRIPMHDLGRSLNLSNSVAIVLFEALRQQDFPNLL